VLLGGVLVFFCFPKMERERKLLAEYQVEDAASPALEAPPPTVPSTA
jgi:hypothetical protein